MKLDGITISILLATVLLFVGLFFLGSSRRSGTVASVQGAVASASAGEALTALTVPETLYDFGSISMKNGLVTKDFIVKNPTSEDIFVPTLMTSCMCTKAFII